MWRCQSCETVNEDTERTCIICGEPRPVGDASVEVRRITSEFRVDMEDRRDVSEPYTDAGESRGASEGYPDAEEEASPRAAESEAEMEWKADERPLGDATAFPAPGEFDEGKVTKTKLSERYPEEDDGSTKPAEEAPKGIAGKVVACILAALFVVLILCAISEG